MISRLITSTLSDHLGWVFAERNGESVVLGQELRQTAVVSNKCGHNAHSTTSLADALVALEIGCHAEAISNVHGEQNQLHSPIARSMKVIVKQKKRTVRPTDLRSTARLQTTMKKVVSTADTS
jgi:hypothetical protein